MTIQPNSLPNLREAFPDYDVSTLPLIPEGWSDASWRKDLCPSFSAFKPYGSNDNEVKVWIDYPAPSDREFDAPRFSVTRAESMHGERYLIQTDDWRAVLAMVDVERGTFERDPNRADFEDDSAYQTALDQHWAEYRLRPLGFLPEVVGGGDLILSAYFSHYGKAGWSILATGSDGGGRPTDTDFQICVYSPLDEGEGPIFEVLREGEPCEDEEAETPLEEAAKAAVQFATGTPSYRQSVLTAEHQAWLGAPEQANTQGMDCSADVLMLEDRATDVQRGVAADMSRRWEASEEMPEDGGSRYSVSEQSLLLYYRNRFDPLDTMGTAIRRGFMSAQIDQIAAEFAERLKGELSGDQWAEMRRLNAAERSQDVCHSHDFCDANIPMAQAFEAVMGREVDPTADDDCALWSAAWHVAAREFLSA